MSSGTVLNIKRFEIHDGPGIRSTLFLKGCPLRCVWCHNPESHTTSFQLAYYAHKCVGCGACAAVCPNGAHTLEGGVHKYVHLLCNTCGKCIKVCQGHALSIFGRKATPKDILPELLADKKFFDYSGGGVTISGGEPLMQPDFAAELFALLQKAGVHTALDTCLYASKHALESVIPYVNLYLIDIKAIDENTHMQCTGVSNKSILKNFAYLYSLGKNIEVRVPYIPERNSGEMEKIADYLARFPRVSGVKILAYHDLSRSKYAALDMPYIMGICKIPSAKDIEKTVLMFRNKGLNAFWQE